MGYVCSNLDLFREPGGQPEWSDFWIQATLGYAAQSLIVQGAMRANLSGVILLDKAGHGVLVESIGAMSASG